MAVSDFLALSSGVGLLCVLRQYEGMSEQWSDFAQSLLGCVAIILIVVGLKQVLGASWPGRRLRTIRQFNRYRVVLPREGMMYLGVMAVMLLGALLGRSNMLMLIFSLMAGPFVVNGWITFAMLKRNQVNRSAPRTAMAGELVSVELGLQNRKRLLSTWLVAARDRITKEREELDANVVFTRVPPRSTRRGFYQMRLHKRGRYVLGPIRLSTRFPLGLVERSQMQESHAEILIYPRLGRLTSRWNSDVGMATEFARRSRQQKGTFDDDFHRLREYFPGDNPRAIHWRTSARHNELMVREYQQSRDHRLAVFLDLWQPSRPTRSDLDRVEYAVSFAATVCVDHLKASQETRLSLWISGRDVTQWKAIPGLSSMESALDTLALVQAGPSSRLGEMFYEALPTLPPNTRSVMITTRTEETGQASAHHAVRSAGVLEELGAQIRVLAADPEQLGTFFVLSEA